MTVRRRNVDITSDIQGHLDERPVNKNYKNNIILPPKPEIVTSATFKYLDAGIGSKRTDSRRAPNGTFNSIGFGLQDNSFVTAEYGIVSFSEESESNILSDIIDLAATAGEVSYDTVMLEREARVSEAVFNTTTFSGADYTLTIASADQWNKTTSKVREHITSASKYLRKRFGVTRSQLELVLSDLLLDDIIDVMAQDSTLIYQNSIRTDSREVQVALATVYLKIGNIIEVTSMFDAKGEGQKGAEFNPMWRADYAMLGLISDSGKSWKGSLGRQPVYTKHSKDFKVSTMYDWDTKTTKVRTEEYRGTFVDKKYGFLLTNCVTLA